MSRMVTYDEILATLPEGIEYGVLDGLKDRVVGALRQANIPVLMHVTYPEKNVRK